MLVRMDEQMFAAACRFGSVIYVVRAQGGGGLAETSVTKTVGISPWNILVGAWLREARGPRTGGMTHGFLRTIEAGANALPAGATPVLVDICGLSFASAASLVASVRMLEQRVTSSAGASQRPYDLGRMEEQASELRRLWPEAHQILTWLEAEFYNLRSAPLDAELIQRVKLQARSKVSDLDVLLRSNSHASGDHDELNPLLADFVRDFERKLSVLSPLMTRNQQTTWEKDNAPRIKAVWGLVSEDTDILNSARKIDWTFLLNSHNPSLQIAVPHAPAEAAAIEVKLSEEITAQLQRPDVVKALELPISVRSYVDFEQRVRELLWFDRTNRSAAPKNLSDLDRQRSGDDRFVLFHNCWIYRLDNGLQPPSLVGFMDNYTNADWRHVSAALDTQHVADWCKLLEEIRE